MITKELFLSGSELPRERVETPEFPGLPFVYVRGLTGRELDTFDINATDDEGRYKPGCRAWLAVLSVCDENSKNIFTIADVAAVSKTNCTVLQRIWVVARRLSGMGAAAQEAAKKNSNETSEDDSASGSPGS